MGFIQRFLQSPQKVFITCVVMALLSLLLNGSFITLWSLYRDRDRLNEQIVTIQGQVVELSAQLRQAHDPNFIEKLALDHFDLVAENDLVFIFPEE